MEFAETTVEFDPDSEAMMELDMTAEAEHDMRVFEMSIQRTGGEFLLKVGIKVFFWEICGHLFAFHSLRFSEKFPRLQLSALGL